MLNGAIWIEKSNETYNAPLHRFSYPYVSEGEDIDSYMYYENTLWIFNIQIIFYANFKALCAQEPRLLYC